MAPSPVTRNMLDELASLNRAFLELIAEWPGENVSDDRLGLPVELALRIGNMALGRRAELAACPGALFSVSWRVLEDSPGGVADVGDAAAEPPLTDHWEIRARRFTTAALFYAWHLAGASPLAALMLLDCPPHVCELLRRTQPGALIVGPAGKIDLPRARLVGNPRFWPDLIRYAEDGDLGKLGASRALCAQLTARHAIFGK